jgi:Restriction endonuclease
MPLITGKNPNTSQELVLLVELILSECGMRTKRQAKLHLRSGLVVADILADENIDGVNHRIICECKNWRKNITNEIVHAFRTIVHDADARRGYVISRADFEAEALETAQRTNIEVITFSRFQNIYFGKWIGRRWWTIENEASNFNAYYELRRPGYHLLTDDNQRAAYDAIWNEYLFAGLALVPFFAYFRMDEQRPWPSLPFDFSELDKSSSIVPADIRAATGYREFLELLIHYVKAGLRQLRAVNPTTRWYTAGTNDWND